MTTITEVLDLPDGKTPRGVRVIFQLAGTDGAPIAGFVGTTSIVGKVSPTVNGAGAYSIELTPNASITPSGTRWKRTVVLESGPQPAPEYLDVPSSGTYRVDQVLDEVPASVPSSALSQEVTTRAAQVAALQASLAALTSGADPSLDTFLEAYTRFLSDESAASALTTTVAGKVAKAGDTMTGDLIVPDEAYDATAWNGSLEVPTKNAVRDKIEAQSGTFASVGDAASAGASATSAVLKQWTSAEAYELTAITRDSDEVPTTGTVKWPDGSAGTFTTVTKNATYLVIDAYTISHTLSGKTVTQAAVTRDSGGAVTVKPALTVA